MYLLSQNESLYCNEDVDTNTSIVTLSTCDLNNGLHSNRRLLLAGFLEEYDETIIVH
jgi:sortase B